MKRKLNRNTVLACFKRSEYYDLLESEKEKLGIGYQNKSLLQKLDALPRAKKYMFRPTFVQSVENYTSKNNKIIYNKMKDLPTGMQDQAGGIISNYIVNIGGFCAGGYAYDYSPLHAWVSESFAGFGDAYCCGPRGFSSSTYALDLTNPTEWLKLPDFPGTPRQGHKCVTADNALYCWGGMSYTPSKEVNTRLPKSKNYTHSYVDGNK